MMFWSHQIVAASGFLAYTDVATGGEWELSTEFGIALVLVMTGAALPDIAHPDSTLGKKVKPISTFISALAGHRGLTHSLAMMVGLYMLGAHFEWTWMFWLVIGIALHLIGDFLTDSGVPLLWPSRKRYRFVLVGSTNGLSEPIMVLLFVSGCIALAWFY